MKNNISESEWKVLEILWKTPGITIGTIRTALESSGWSYSTIKTLVSRLVQKGAVSVSESHEGKRYSPIVNENECRMHETKNFLERIYNGSVKMMVSNLVKDSNLSDSDAKELLDLIDKMED